MPTDPALLKLQRSHSNRIPDEAAQATIKLLRQMFLDLAVAIQTKIPLGAREVALALTNLEQARFWATTAACAEGELKDPPIINLPK